jgi:hypothetical protein
VSFYNNSYTAPATVSKRGFITHATEFISGRP